MPTGSAGVRHGLYLKGEVLDEIKRIARSAKRSINKQLEMIILDWLASQKSQDGKGLTRAQFHALPLWRKREILAAQAEAAASVYSPDEVWDGIQRDDVLEI